MEDILLQSIVDYLTDFLSVDEDSDETSDVITVVRYGGDCNCYQCGRY